MGGIHGVRAREAQAQLGGEVGDSGKEVGEVVAPLPPRSLYGLDVLCDDSGLACSALADLYVATLGEQRGENWK